MAGPFGVGAIWVYTVPESGNPVRIGLAHEGAEAEGESPFVFDWDAELALPSAQGAGRWRLKRDSGSYMLNARTDYDRFSEAEAGARRAMSLDRKRDSSNIKETNWPWTASGRDPSGPNEPSEIDPGYMVKLLGWANNSWSQIVGYLYLGSSGGNPGYEYWWIGHVANFRAALSDRGVVLADGVQCSTVGAAEGVISAAITANAFQPDPTHRQKYRTMAPVSRGVVP